MTTALFSKVAGSSLREIVQGTVRQMARNYDHSAATIFSCDSPSVDQKHDLVVEVERTGKLSIISALGRPDAVYPLKAGDLKRLLSIMGMDESPFSEVSVYRCLDETVADSSFGAPAFGTSEALGFRQEAAQSPGSQLYHQLFVWSIVNHNQDDQLMIRKVTKVKGDFTEPLSTEGIANLIADFWGDQPGRAVVKGKLGSTLDLTSVPGTNHWLARYSGNWLKADLQKPDTSAVDAAMNVLGIPVKEMQLRIAYM